jgi:hypothetical protein
VFPAIDEPPGRNGAAIFGGTLAAHASPSGDTVAIAPPRTNSQRRFWRVPLRNVSQLILRHSHGERPSGTRCARRLRCSASRTRCRPGRREQPSSSVGGATVRASCCVTATVTLAQRFTFARMRYSPSVQVGGHEREVGVGPDPYGYVHACCLAVVHAASPPRATTNRA